MQTRTRRRPAVRRRVATAAFLAAAPLLASCGFDVATDAVYQPAEGSNARSAGVDVLGAVVVSDTKGTGRLVATLVDKRNSGDQLTAIMGNKVQVSSPGTVKVPSNSVGFANLADEQYTPITVTGSSVDAGGYVEMRFSFDDSAPVTIDVPVVDTSGTYSGLAPGQSGSSDSDSSASNDTAAAGSQGAFPAPSASPSAGGAQ